MCQEVANGVCNGPHHYFNMFKLHYCTFGGSKFLFISVVILITMVCFLWLNYVRRSYYVRPIMKLRNKLGLNGQFSEAILVPLAYGIVPLIIRIQGAQKNIDFNFNLSASLGSMFTLGAFIIGLSAVLIKVSKTMDSTKITINLLFTVVALALMMLLGLKKEADYIDGVIFVGAWVAYLLFIHLNSEKNGKKKFFVPKNIILNFF